MTDHEDYFNRYYVKYSTILIIPISNSIGIIISNGVHSKEAISHIFIVIILSAITLGELYEFLKRLNKTKWKRFLFVISIGFFSFFLYYATSVSLEFWLPKSKLCDLSDRCTGWLDAGSFEYRGGLKALDDNAKINSSLVVDALEDAPCNGALDNRKVSLIRDTTFSAYLKTGSSPSISDRNSELKDKICSEAAGEDCSQISEVTLHSGVKVLAKQCVASPKGRSSTGYEIWMEVQDENYGKKFF